MRSTPPRKLRTIGIFAHIDAGKTSLTERLLLVAGRLRKAGDVESGSTATDFLAVERQRGITVKAAAVRLSRKGYGIRLLDTPGHVDFEGEIERSLRALDGALLLLCGVAGVQSRTEALYRAARERGAPLLAFVNKMDRRGASFERALTELRRLEPRAVPIQLPWGEGEEFRGLVDLVAMVAYDFRNSDPEETSPLLPSPSDIPAELQAPALAARSALVDILAEEDEALFELVGGGGKPSPVELGQALRRASLSSRVLPLLCGSAFLSGPASLLLDAVIDYLPGPEEALPPLGHDPEGKPLRREPSPEAPFSALVFKTSSDPSFERLSWARIWSGRLLPGDRVLDATSGRTLRVRKLLSIQAAGVEELDSAEAGDIVAIAFGALGQNSGKRRPAEGRGEAELSLGEERPGGTGASLCDPASPILYEAIPFAEPVVSLVLEPRRASEGPALREAALALVELDPSLRLREERETGRIILGGSGELHLEVAMERLAEEFGVRPRFGRPEVSYREGLAAPAEGSADFARNENGENLKASVRLRLLPRQRGSGTEVKVPAGTEPLLEAAVRRGAEAALSIGPLAGYPLEDLSVEIEELALPEARGGRGKGRELAAEIAASLALRGALEGAQALLLEPSMRVEIRVPEEGLGAALASIAGRGGRVESVEDQAEGKLVVAAAPLRALFGFAGELRSATAGKASHSARFLRYEPAPRALGR